MQVGLDHMLNLEPVLDRVPYVDAGIALRVDHRGDAAGADQIGGMGQTGKIELLEVHYVPRRVLF